MVMQIKDSMISIHGYYGHKEEGEKFLGQLGTELNIVGSV